VTSARATAYCTYFDINYLTRGLALYESLAKFDPALDFWVVCLDDDTATILEAMALPGVNIVRLVNLERWDPELMEVKPTRSRVEYYFTLTPLLPLFVFEHRPRTTTVAYVDADLYFYADPAPVLDLLDGKSVLIVPHGFPPHLAHLRSHGIFNVGLVGFERGEAALACLARWRRQCLDWCYDRVDGERFADQGYLNDWPEVVEGTVVVDRPGVGLAPWNFMRYKVDVRVQPPTANGDAVVFYHFQGLKQLFGPFWDTGLTGYGPMSRALRRRLYGDYIAALSRWAQLAASMETSRILHRASSARDRAKRWRHAIRLIIERQLTIRFRGRTL
jgi:hypothetical protein